MDSHKQSTIAYAVGYIEDYIEDKAQPLEEGEDDDQETVQFKLNENEHREQVRAMMNVISDGLTQLARENAALLNKIFLAEAALKG